VAKRTGEPIEPMTGLTQSIEREKQEATIVAGAMYFITETDMIETVTAGINLGVYSRFFTLPF